MKLKKWGLGKILKMRVGEIHTFRLMDLLKWIQEFETNYSPTLAKQISKCYKENKQYENALNWHEKAMEHNSEKLASDYLELARHYSLVNNKTEAREKLVK